MSSDNGLVPNRRRAIIWTKCLIVYWSLYESLGIDDLTSFKQYIFHTYSLEY